MEFEDQQGHRNREDPIAEGLDSVFAQGKRGIVGWHSATRAPLSCGGHPALRRDCPAAPSDMSGTGAACLARARRRWLTALVVEGCRAEIDAKAATPDGHRLVRGEIHLRWHRVVLIADIALQGPEVYEARGGHGVIVGGIRGGH